MKLYIWKPIAWVVTIQLSLGGSIAWGAELVLHERFVPNGPVVRLGDIADISAVSSLDLDQLVTTLLLPSPAPGTRQYLSASQIRELLISRGVDAQNLHFRGAAAVQIGESRKPRSQTVGATLPKASQQQVETAVRAAIEQHLREQTGYSQWRVEPTLNAAEHRRMARLGNKLIARGGKAPWTGTQRFEIQGETVAQNAVVTAQVAKIQPVVVAKRPIQQGDLIRTSDVQLRQHEGSVPSRAFSTLDQVLGMQARRSIQADAIIQQSHVRAPLQVERGETVTVFARTAGITVRTYAIARQDGALGDLVQVQTLDSKDRFTARVSGRRELEVFATGASAGDFATLQRRKTLQR